MTVITINGNSFDPAVAESRVEVSDSDSGTSYIVLQTNDVLSDEEKDLQMRRMYSHIRPR